MNLMAPAASGSSALMLRSTRSIQPFGACAHRGTAASNASTTIKIQRFICNPPQEIVRPNNTTHPPLHRDHMHCSRVCYVTSMKPDMAGLKRILWRRAGAANDLILTPSSIPNNVLATIDRTAQSYSLVSFARSADVWSAKRTPDRLDHWA